MGVEWLLVFLERKDKKRSDVFSVALGEYVMSVCWRPISASALPRTEGKVLYIDVLVVILIFKERFAEDSKLLYRDTKNVSRKSATRYAAFEEWTKAETEEER